MFNLHKFFGRADYGCADSLGRIYGLNDSPNPRIEDMTKVPGHQEVHAMKGCQGEVIGVASGFLGNLYRFEINVGQSSYPNSNLQYRKPSYLLKAQFGRHLIAP